MITKIISMLLLLNISWKAKFEAGVEMLVNVLFSTLPIWFGGLIYGIVTHFSQVECPKNFAQNFASGIFKNISNGELLMYAAATLGPTLYLGLSSFGTRQKPFPWIRPQLIVAILITLLATVLFFVSRDKQFTKDVFFVCISSAIYFLSLVLLYPSMAFQHSQKLDVSEIQTEEQDAFMNGYRRHRG